MANNTFFKMLSFGLLGFYVGSGLANGYKMEKKVISNTLKYNDQITYVTNESKRIEIIGKNSSYIFYAEKNDSKIRITPIAGVIKNIKEIK